eukprot:scaffold4446_cov272-Chaetoceros_neogracile.AAC.2
MSMLPSDRANLTASIILSRISPTVGNILGINDNVNEGECVGGNDGILLGNIEELGPAEGEHEAGELIARSKLSLKRIFSNASGRDSLIMLSTEKEKLRGEIVNLRSISAQKKFDPDSTESTQAEREI